MSGIIAAACTGITWCFCTATASLCSSWCGNDKPSTVPPSATSGRKRSVILLALSVVIALIYQYALAPNYNKIPWTYINDAWSSGCDDNGSSSSNNAELREVCSGNAGVYRASSAAFVFFIIFGIAAKCKPTANREAWPAKYFLFLCLCVGTIFIPNDPLFLPIYLWIARVGSVIFVLLQQIILVDIAYNWNTAWIDRSDQAELDEGPGKGKKWLAAILISCGILYTCSLAGIVVMYIHFTGCPTNNAFISITLLMSALCTIVQLTNKSETGSLLTSGCMTLYATYLCGAAVSKNPNAVCNPKLGETSTWSIVVGLCIAFMSMTWAGWSYTTDKRLGGGRNGGDDDDNDDGGGGEEEEVPKTGGVVINNDSYGATNGIPLTQSAAAASHQPSENPTSFGGSWKLNATLALICCWYAMTLTGWGAIEKRGDIANPDVGEISMWMLIGSQWISLLFYFWTLVAPSLFPDRDFS
mmetsp:Transcript_565/g.1022  ORF Transcript_565/g.1022 Transcript_565/m.1022 type:complete len:471 (+) Transcript_565:322-1734(+)|eukprot:CAMPEP_0201660172 /NCGR_PEP_ID=MMETSP0494-20130426/2853_1 /ASSEMBLY_ACC=CAM_ASM_000839 /TAXON_ID=420259 /ORGANISM="Thalassiosira gravida, Strain GMp14c1" /LENGTH=470 /DNA_ID=CAMNT_0048137929 /DNA_START=307 /DNA_END=1719 /DNA_ORIENTATION=+